MKACVSTFLDISRWFAAFLVVINHARSFVLVNYEDVKDKSVLGKGIYMATGLGHEAVVIFFVISGFLVGGFTFERWQSKGPDLVSYASARISRIYTVLIPALIIGVSLDYVGLHWLNSSSIYTDVLPHHIASMQNAIATTVNIPTFVGNLLMMQGTLTGMLGSNGPLWSLAYEWWYYCIFALIGAAIVDTSNRRMAYAGAALLIAVLLPGKLLLWGLIWGLGIVAHRWIRSTLWRPAPALGIGIFLLALLASRVSHGTVDGGEGGSLLASFVRDSVLGIAFATALASSSRMTSRAPLSELHHRLAEFSYTTYLFHFPALLVLVAGAYQAFGINFPQQPGLHGVAYFAGCVAAVYLYCFASYLLIERHTPRVRTKLEWLMRRAAFGLPAQPDTER